MCVDITYFTTNQDILNNYICPIGKGIIIDPIYLNCASSKAIHVFCKECIVTHEKGSSYYYNNRCPICQSSYTKIEIIPYYENVINNFELKCENGTCEWSGTVEKYKIHRNSCEERIIKCPSEGCSKDFKYVLLQDHTNECEFAKLDCAVCQVKYIRKLTNDHTEMIKCDDCENEYNKCLFSKHQTMCVHRKTQCYMCKMYHKEKDRLTHNDECSERFIDCKECKTRFQFKYQNEERYKRHAEYKDCEFCNQNYALCIIEKHLISDCELVSRKCEIEGCGQSYTKQTYNQHMSDNVGQHCMLSIKSINKKVGELDQKMTTCLDKITQMSSDVDRIERNVNNLDTIDELVKKLLDHFNVSYN